MIAWPFKEKNNNNKVCPGLIFGRRRRRRLYSYRAAALALGDNGGERMQRGSVEYAERRENTMRERSSAHSDMWFPTIPLK